MLSMAFFAAVLSCVEGKKPEPEINLGGPKICSCGVMILHLDVIKNYVAYFVNSRDCFHSYGKSLLDKMRVKSPTLNCLHLDRSFGLLTVKNTCLLLEYFKLLDVHDEGKINDVQFYQFMKHSTNLKKRQMFLVLDMLDQQATGYISFDQFYMLACILIALKDKVEKEFIFRHSKLVFEMLDEDGGGSISAHEFGQYGFLFNLKEHSVRDIFFEFDVSGDEELDFKEFKFFAMACIDKQRELDKLREEKQAKRNKAENLPSKIYFDLDLD